MALLKVSGISPRTLCSPWLGEDISLKLRFPPTFVWGKGGARGRWNRSTTNRWNSRKCYWRGSWRKGCERTDTSRRKRDWSRCRCKCGCVAGLFDLAAPDVHAFASLLLQVHVTVGSTRVRNLAHNAIEGHNLTVRARRCPF
jgi:hypothetical protein